MDKYQHQAVRIMEYLMLVAAIVLVLFGKITGDTFFLRLATEALIFGGLALSVDLLLGIVGLLSLGQALYFGFGAYLSALILRDWMPSFAICIVIVAIASAILGWVTSYIALRSKGVYFALISFGLAQVFAKSIYNTRSLGASDGMVGVPIVQIPLPFITLNLGDAITFFVVTFVFMACIYFALKYFLYTPLGRIWGGVRSNESRLPYLGYDTQTPKRIAFILAAIVAGVSGALYPMLRGFVSPELMYFSVSGNAVITVVLGGVGTLIGSLFGSSLLMILKSIIGTLTLHHHIVIGLLFIVVVVFAPKGIVGILCTKLKERAVR